MTRRRELGALATVALALGLGCVEPASRTARPAPPTGTAVGTTTRVAPAPPASGEGAPTLGTPDVHAGTVELPIPGFLPALAFVPPGGPEDRFPLAVVLHGAGGRPEPHCDRWRHLLAERAYVVCPRGTPLGLVPPGGEPEGYFYRDHRALGLEVAAAVGAARSTFGPRLDARRALLAGFSQGATMGALFLHELPRFEGAEDVFARVALVEGGSAEWNIPLAGALRARGVERVLLVCGQSGCSRDAPRSVGYMRKAGLDVRYEAVAGGGHAWGGEVGERVERALPWLLEGDTRFARGPRFEGGPRLGAAEAR